MTRRRATVFLNADLAWDRFHVMMTRNTTPDFIRLSRRLSDFFTHQFQSGKKVLESIGPGYYPQYHHHHSSHHRQHRRSHPSRHHRYRDPRNGGGGGGGLSSDEDFLLTAHGEAEGGGASDASSDAASSSSLHRHHRHWQRPLAAVLGADDGLAGLVLTLPKRGMLEDTHGR